MEAEGKTACQPAHSPQRRTHPRHEVDEDATLLLLSQNSRISCRVTDISADGCRLRTESPFVAGIRIRVEVAFHIRGIAFRFSGVSARTSDKHVVGIHFVDVPARRRDELAEVLCEVEAEELARAKKALAGQIAAQARVETPVPIQEEKKQQLAQPNPAGPRPAQLAQPAAAGPLLSPRALTISRPLAGPLPKLEPIANPLPLPRLEPIVKPQLLSMPQSPPNSHPAPTAASTKLADPSKPAFSSGRDRRAQSRHGVDTSAVILLINIASQVRGRILDLSVGGCRIHTNERFPVGICTRVEAEFHLEGLPFRLGGVIQAIHDQGRQLVGIRFLDMSVRKREQVEQLMKEIEEARATP
jgi:c-di-GMP-binding flagellar brake protein YcgR